MTSILIVEDSAAQRAHLRASLEGLPELAGGAEIIEASSGFEALRLLPRNRYDLVITDVNLPGIDGIELLRFVRQSPQNRDVGLIIVSNSSSIRDRSRALAVGADAFLAKPFVPEVLRDAVARVLNGERRVRRSDPGMSSRPPAGSAPPPGAPSAPPADAPSAPPPDAPSAPPAGSPSALPADASVPSAGSSSGPHNG